MRRRGVALLCSFAAAATGLVLTGTPPAAAVPGLALSTIGTDTYDHPAGCGDTTPVTTAYRVTTFHTTAMTDVNVSVAGTTPGFTPAFFLYTSTFDPDNPLTGCYDYTTTGSATYLTLPASTTYQIVVTGATAGAAGDYTLAITGSIDQVISSPDAPRLSLSNIVRDGMHNSVHIDVLSALNTQGEAANLYEYVLTDVTTGMFSDTVTASTGVDASVAGAAADVLTLEVTAHNSTGYGPEAVVSKPPMPTVQLLTANGDGTSATLAWSVGPLTKYDFVTAGASQPSTTPLAPVQLGAAGPDVIGGLAEGQTYDVTVTAANVLDFSSAATVHITMQSRPGKPSLTAGAPTASDTVPVTIGAAPVVAGSNPVTAYTVTATAAGAPTKVVVANNPGLMSVAGLRPATTYAISVTATNTVGTGAASSPVSVTTPPVMVPTPVSAAVPAPGKLTVFFKAPGTPVTVTAVPDGGGAPVSVTGTTSPLVIKGLTNGTTYTVYVTNVGAIPPTTGGRRFKVGNGPTVVITLADKTLAPGATTTIKGTAKAAGSPLAGAKVALARTLKGKTTTLARRVSNAKGAVAFTTKAVKGASYRLVLTIATFTARSKAGTLHVR